eukprot:scaffold8044_cov38-Cyclotella_meneghiniana.AAC.3
MPTSIKHAASSHAIVILAAALSLLAITTHGFSFSSIQHHSPTKFDTKVAVNGQSIVTVHPPSHAASKNVTLSTYMRLPVEQYVLIPMPLGSSLTRIEDKEEKISNNNNPDVDMMVSSTMFELQVPTITFFNLRLQPIVYATVQPYPDKVVISSTKCILHGSPFIEKVRLNERFVFNVQCTLTWSDDLLRKNHPQSRSTSTNDEERILTELKQTSSSSSTACTITANTSIDVDVNVPRPFNSIPKRILQKTGNAAMKLSMKYVQRSFVENLGKDYEKWAKDVGYREYRASLSKDS